MANALDLVRELRELVVLERRASAVHVVLPILTKLDELRAALENTEQHRTEPHQTEQHRTEQHRTEQHRARAERAERELADLRARFEKYRSEVESEAKPMWAVGLKAAGRAVTGILGRLRGR